MKKIYILAAGLLALLAAACNKDGSTAAGPITQLKVTGLKDTVTVFTHKDFLKITPTVENENNYDYYWTLFSSEFNAVSGAKLIKPDTIGRTKDLNYEVLKDPGAYILVFNAKEKSTGVVGQVTMVANITTLNMKGWYLVKDLGGKTDMDFIYDSGRINNWIAFYNGGKSLDGNAVSAAFVPSMRANITSQTYFSTLMVASQNDAGIYRVDNGAMYLNFDNMFFSKPATRKPQGVFQPISSNNVNIINDGKGYYMSKGALFSNMPTFSGSISYSNLSPFTASVAMDLAWDPVRKTIVLFNGATFKELSVVVTSGVSNGLNKLQNVNGNLQWMAGYTGNSSQAMLLFRNPQDTGYLYRVNGQYGQMFYGTPGVIVTNSDTLKPQHSLMSASVICGNYDVPLIYYVTNGKVYMTDVATATETYLFDVPVGETITAMQHIKYPEPTSSLVVNKMNYIAIATYNGSRYKIYLHTMSGTNTISALPQANFDGDGRVSRIIYMENGVGTRIY